MRPLRLAALLAGLALALPGRGAGASRLFLQEIDAGGAGTFDSFGDADGGFTARQDAGGLDLSFAASNTFFQVRLLFVAQGGGPPGPGTYEGVRSSTYHPPQEGPLLGVFLPDDYYCYEFSGRFVVHELALAGDGSVVAFSADYERHCTDGSMRIGAVRFRTGDGVCAAAPDGTPCDDGDACTAGDGCVAAGCTGTDVVSPACPPSDVCRRAPVCNPIDGVCTAPTVGATTPCDDGDPTTADDRCGDGTCAGCDHTRACEEYVGRGFDGECLYLPYTRNGQSCDDGDPCTVTDVCTEGRCAGAPAVCDDADPCTDDGCDSLGGGCTAVPRAGCWTILGPAVVRYAASGVVQGRHVSCAARCRSAQEDGLFFDPGDRFRIPVGTMADCPAGPVVFPDLVGAVRTLRRGFRLLSPENLDAFEAALRQCSGGGARLLGMRIVLRAAAEPDLLEGKWRLRVRIPEVLPVYATSVTHFFAVLRTARQPLAPELPRRAQRLRVCVPPVRIRCSLD